MTEKQVEELFNSTLSIMESNRTAILKSMDMILLFGQTLVDFEKRIEVLESKLSIIGN